jgi:DNA replication factor GINS
MYDELYAAWRREIEDASLGGLPPDFYSRITDYQRRISEENRILDKKSVKAVLLEHEALHVELMLNELVWARYKKLLKIITQNQKVPSELLAIEEAKMFEGFLSFTEAYNKFAKSLLQGQAAKEEIEVTHKRTTLRFSKSVPSIIGADMKTYGPFVAEDVASLPVENARILVKQGLAVLVEVS